MPYVNALGMLQDATSKGYAIGAFNILNELTARAIVNACDEMKAPVILQTSCSTVKQIGIKAIIGFLRPIAEGAAVPVSVHLDHCKDLDLAKACIDAGWLSIMIDGSHLPLQENIAMTKEIVDYAAGKGVSIEGELGAIGGVEDEIVVGEEDAHLARVEDAVIYVQDSGIDIFAPAIGTAHGLYKGVPKLDFDRFVEIRDKVSAPLVVHGGTGLATDVFRKLVGLGASKINISTALKHAYIGGFKDYLSANPDNKNPLKMDLFVENQIKELAREHIAIFGTENQA